MERVDDKLRTMDCDVITYIRHMIYLSILKINMFTGVCFTVEGRFGFGYMVRGTQ